MLSTTLSPAHTHNNKTLSHHFQGSAKTCPCQKWSDLLSDPSCKQLSAQPRTKQKELRCELQMSASPGEASTLWVSSSSQLAHFDLSLMVTSPKGQHGSVAVLIQPTRVPPPSSLQERSMPPHPQACYFHPQLFLGC